MVTVQVNNLSLKDKVTLTDVERILHDSRIALDNELSKQPSDFLINFMLPPLVRFQISSQTVIKLNELFTLLINRKPLHRQFWIR